MLPESISKKDSEHSLLWNKIKQFNFDAVGSLITFKYKLAKQQKWTEDFTERVIEEYRKFIFLCCISPTGASPSQTVDEVWHLHLTYTQSYWIDLCKTTLGRDLHHYPTKGGEEENRKHQDWYKKTLELYVQIFEAAPPLDVWPTPKEPSTSIYEFNSLNENLNEVHKYVIPCVILLPLISMFCSFFPYNLDGPQFLIFYALLGVTSAVIIYIINEKKSNKLNLFIRNQLFPENINAFQLAEFYQGKDGVVQTSILDFVQKGLLSVTKGKKFIVSNKDYLPYELNPYSEALCKVADGEEVDYNEIKLNWSMNSFNTNPTLENIKKILTAQSLIKTRLFLAVIIIGFIRIDQGAMKGYPVVLLITELFLFAVAVLVTNKFNSPKKLYPEIKRAIISKKSELNIEQDEIVTDFAINGRWATTAFTNMAMLASIFFVSTPALGAGGGGGDGGGGGGCGSGGGCGGGCGGCGGG